MGINPFIGATLIQTGSGILGGLLPNPNEDRRKELFGIGKGLFNQSPYNVDSIIGGLNRDAHKYLLPYAGILEKRLGLDSGVAQGELMNMLAEIISRNRFGLEKENSLARFQGNRQVFGGLTNLT